MKPDASRHDPRPEYLRTLIEKTGLSQREVAERIGIGFRLLKYYLTTPGAGKEARTAPYPVQYAIESLAARRRPHADVPGPVAGSCCCNVCTTPAAVSATASAA